MVRSYAKAKGRRESGAFVPLPCSVLDHPNFINLTAKGTRLLIDLCSQLRFKQGGPTNNGDICATISVLKKRGWSSSESLDYAIKELLHYEFILLTRRGDRKRCHLYGLTWWAVNECDGKIDSGIPTRVPLGNWRILKEKWQRPKRKLKSVPRFSKNITRISEHKTKRGGNNVSK